MTKERKMEIKPVWVIDNCEVKKVDDYEWKQVRVKNGNNGYMIWYEPSRVGSDIVKTTIEMHASVNEKKALDVFIDDLRYILSKHE